jgi:hypothetical protein
MVVSSGFPVPLSVGGVGAGGRSLVGVAVVVGGFGELLFGAVDEFRQGVVVVDESFADAGSGFDDGGEHASIGVADAEGVAGVVDGVAGIVG